eukprot:Em0015g159a
MPYTAMRTDDSQNMPYTAMRTENMPYMATRTDDSQGHSVTRSRRLYSVDVEMSGVLDDGGVKLPCEFCKQQFSMSEFILHQARCQIAHEKPVDVVGIMQRASISDDPVDTMVDCCHCMEQYPESYVKQHESVCDRNPEKELLKAIPSGLGRHQASPPPSTDDIQDEIPCEFCCQPFPLEVLDGHQAVCEHNPDTELLNAVHGDLGRHQASPPLPPLPSLLSVDKESQVPCEFCCQPFPFEVVDGHQAVCDRNPEMVVLNAIPSGLGRHQASPPPSTDEENQVPCEFCNKLFPFDELTGHQALCSIMNKDGGMGRVRREPAAHIDVPRKRGGHERVGGYGVKGDYRGGDYGKGDYRGGDYGKGDYRGDDYGIGDYRGDDYRGGDYGKGVYRGGDYRGGDGKGDYRGGDYGKGDYRGDDYGKSDYRGDDYGKGDYRGGEHGKGEYRAGGHSKGGYRGGDHGKGDYRGGDHGKGVYRGGDHSGEDHHRVDDSLPWEKRPGGSDKPTLFEERSRLKDFSDLGSSTSEVRGEGVDHPPLVRGTESQYGSKACPVDHMDFRMQHKTGSHRRGNHTTTGKNEFRQKRDIPLTTHTGDSKTQGSPLTHDDTLAESPLKFTSRLHQIKPLVTKHTPSGHSTHSSRYSAGGGLPKPKGSRSKTIRSAESTHTASLLEGDPKVSAPLGGASSKKDAYRTDAGQKGTSLKGPAERPSAKGHERRSAMETKLPKAGHAQREDGLEGVELQISKLSMEDRKGKPKHQPSSDHVHGECLTKSEGSLGDDDGRSVSQTTYKRSSSTEVQGPNKYPRTTSPSPVGGQSTTKGIQHTLSGRGTGRVPVSARPAKTKL